jgi:hypothetical protein
MIIQEPLKAFIQRRNQEQSDTYSSPAARLERQLYRAQHPTEILALKCMDGRLNLAIYTNTPPGIIQPFRNIGGKFDLGWPFFQEVIKGTVNYATSMGRRAIVLITYHFSKGSPHRGCAGYGYETGAARDGAFVLRDQFAKVFGNDSRVVYPLVIGIETDEESLIFHSKEGQLDIAELTDVRDVHAGLTALYPEMEMQMSTDLVALAEGNFHHILDIRTRGKELIDHEHREQIIAVGRGFDWLHMPNAALIIGPYSNEWLDDWKVAVERAGQIALSNIRDGRIPKEFGVLLLVGALSRDPLGSFGWNMAREKAMNLMRNSRNILEKQVPELRAHLHFLCGIVSGETRKLHELEC